MDDLALALTDENARVRAEAARALGHYDTDGSRRALIAGTSDPDIWVVAEALKSLGSVGDDRALPMLQAAAASNSSPIAIAALQGLFCLNPPILRAAIEKAASHADPEVVKEAISASLRLSSEEASGILFALLEHRAWSVRLGAIRALVNRAVAVPDALLSRCRHQEEEPIVLSALEDLRGGDVS